MYRKKGRQIEEKVGKQFQDDMKDIVSEDINKDHLDEWLSKHSALLSQVGIPPPQVNELHTEINKLIRII